MKSNREHAGKSIGEPLHIDPNKIEGYGADDIEIPHSNVAFAVEEASWKTQSLMGLVVSRYLDMPPPRNARTRAQIVEEGMDGLTLLVGMAFHLAERAVLALEYGKTLLPPEGEEEEED